MMSDLTRKGRLSHPSKAPIPIVPIPIVLTPFGILMLVRDLQSPNVLLVDYQYYTLKTVEKWQNRFCVDTKNVRFNVFNFWLHQNHIDMDWMGAFEPTP